MSAQHHTLSLLLAPAGGELQALRPSVHEADIDILGFTADITVYERYRLDSAAQGTLLAAFAGSAQRELLSCTITLGDGPGEVAMIRDGTGLSMLQGPVVDGHRSIVLELRFVEQLPRARGHYELRYAPPACVRANDETLSDDTAHPVWISLSLAAGMPIGDICCPSHDARIWYDGARSARVLPDLTSGGDNLPFVLRYALDGEELVEELDIFEAPDGDLYYMFVLPGEQTAETARR
ncbi:MAG: hypothetical protein GF331_06695 [Chitinivibrionales bacterium]|nr:hypothetical protein [Chitinivibrionales bacterium]